MSFASWLVVMSTLSGPTSSTAPEPLTAPAAAMEAPAQRSADPQILTPRPHRLGLGASMGISNRGAAGAMRYWFGQRVGVDLTAGYYRRNIASNSRVSSTQVMPSVLVMLTDAHPSRDVDLRPYAGGGINYARTSSLIQTGTSTTSRASGTGMQAFGGVEMTFKDTDNVAISAEMGYYQQPVRLITSPAANGVTYRVFVHLYMN